ncbi:hypothetical protein Bca101_091770 [Brassica carinata]
MAAIWSLAEYLQMRRERDLILEILKRKAVAPQVFSESEIHTLLSDIGTGRNTSSGEAPPSTLESRSQTKAYPLPTNPNNSTANPKPRTQEDGEPTTATAKPSSLLGEVRETRGPHHRTCTQMEAATTATLQIRRSNRARECSDQTRDHQRDRRPSLPTMAPD